MEDEKIIALYWARSEQAIGETDKKYGKLCHTLSRNLLGSSEDAEECVNDTYHGLWEAIPPAKPNPLAVFIARITRNLAMKRLTHRNAGKRTGHHVSFDELEECIPARGSPEEHLAGKELSEALDRFLDTLDGTSRDIFLRRYWFFDTVEQIAVGLGMTKETVRQRLHRTRGKLKVFLEEEVGIYVR